jgi:uncharacterized protein YcaQ
MTAGTALQPPPQLELSSREARQLAVAAVGFDLPDSSAVLRHTGLLQLDPLSRVDKAHRLTCLARMPATASGQGIDGPLWSSASATAFETWVHAACLVPIADWPLLRLARERVRSSPRRPPEPLLADVRAIVERSPHGATIGEIERPDKKTTGWQWSDRKRAVEHMLRTGELVCSRRRGTTRLFDLPEHRVPPDLLRDEPPVDTILAALALRALAAMGIATAADIARYYNLTTDAASRGLAAASARPVRVRGWNHTAWIPKDVNDIQPAAHEPLLVGPFDNLIWDRDRVRRLFDFNYLFEAYKPAAKRRYGYYVLALLDKDNLIGRADLRRTGHGLLTLAATPEATTDTTHFTRTLDVAHHRLARQIIGHTT